MIWIYYIDVEIYKCHNNFRLSISYFVLIRLVSAKLGKDMLDCVLAKLGLVRLNWDSLDL
jgi:hypothetical protein